MSNQETSNLEAVVFVLGRLGGAMKKVSTEDIAAEAHKLSPDRFSWKSPAYRHIPDKDLVRVALTDAAKPRHGGLVAGRYGVASSGKRADGWRLTAAGVEWITQNGGRVAKAFSSSLSDVPQRELLRFVSKIKSEIAFLRWQSAGDIDAVESYMFTDLLNCSPDAPSQIVCEKYERLRNMAKLSGDKEIDAFVNSCGQRFDQLLTRREG